LVAIPIVALDQSSGGGIMPPAAPSAPGQAGFASMLATAQRSMEAPEIAAPEADAPALATQSGSSPANSKGQVAVSANPPVKKPGNNLEAPNNLAAAIIPITAGSATLHKTVVSQAVEPFQARTTAPSSNALSTNPVLPTNVQSMDSPLPAPLASTALPANSSQGSLLSWNGLVVSPSPASMQEFSPVFFMPVSNSASQSLVSAQAANTAVAIPVSHELAATTVSAATAPKFQTPALNSFSEKNGIDVNQLPEGADSTLDVPVAYVAELGARRAIDTDSVASTSGASTSLVNELPLSNSQAQSVPDNRAPAGSIPPGLENSGVGVAPDLGSLLLSEAGTTGVSATEMSAVTLASETNAVDARTSANLLAPNGSSPNSSLQAAAPSADDTSFASIHSLLSPILAVAQKGSGAFAAPGLPVASDVQDLVRNSLGVPTEAASVPRPVQASLPEPASVASALTAQARLVAPNTGHDPGSVAIHAASAETGKTRASQALLSSSAPNTGLALSNKTPFDVFFSNPQPDTEAAASVLPRMVLPVSGPSTHDFHPSANAAANATSQVAAVQGNAHSNASASNADPDATNPTSSPAAQSQSRDTDLPAQLQGAVADNAGAQVAAAPMASPAATNFPIAALGPSNPEPSATQRETPDQPAGIPTNPGPPPPEIQATAGPVQLAQLTSRPELSEMRIGLSTTAFGGVEVRTVVHANDVGVLIGSEKGDLRALLQNDLPAITNTLQEQNLRLHSVNFMQGFAFSNDASSARDQSQQRSFVPQRSSENLNTRDASNDGNAELPPAMAYSIAPGALSILA
jgi:hypothetical protein